MFFQHTYDKSFLPIQKLIKGQKYRRKCVDNKSRNLFGATAKKRGDSYAERKRWRKSFLLDSKQNMITHFLCFAKLWGLILISFRGNSIYCRSTRLRENLGVKRSQLMLGKKTTFPFPLPLENLQSRKWGKNLVLEDFTQCNYYSRDKMRRL